MVYLELEKGSEMLKEMAPTRMVDLATMTPTS
jgi:hypothetical protein